MELSYVVQRIKNGTTLNISHDFWDDVDFVYHINNAIGYIFSTMNSFGNWYYSNTEEEIGASDWTESDTFTTQYDISNFRLVLGDWTPLVQSNVNFNIPAPEYSDEGTGDYYLAWSNKIVTRKKYKKITIYYSRFNKRHDHDNLWEKIDIPKQLLGVLEFLVFWRVMPVFYEQGASLANNYLNQAKEELQAYASNIWFISQQKWFLA